MSFDAFNNDGIFLLIAYWLLPNVNASISGWNKHVHRNVYEFRDLLSDPIGPGYGSEVLT